MLTVVCGCVWWFVCRQAGRQRQGGSSDSCWLVVVGVSKQAYIGGNGRMEGREGMQAEGEQDACCEVWDWLEGREGGGQWKIAKNFWKPGKRLGCVATQKLMHVSTACPPRSTANGQRS